MYSLASWYESNIHLYELLLSILFHLVRSIPLFQSRDGGTVSEEITFNSIVWTKYFSSSKVSFSWHIQLKLKETMPCDKFSAQAHYSLQGETKQVFYRSPMSVDSSSRLDTTCPFKSY